MTTACVNCDVETTSILFPAYETRVNVHTKHVASS